MPGSVTTFLLPQVSFALIRVITADASHGMRIALRLLGKYSEAYGCLLGHARHCNMKQRWR